MTDFSADHTETADEMAGFLQMMDRDYKSFDRVPYRKAESVLLKRFLKEIIKNRVTDN